MIDFVRITYKVLRRRGVAFARVAKKVLPSVNASRKEKSDNKLAFEKQDEQADTSISTNSEGEQKEKTIKSTKTLRLTVQLAFKVDLLNFS